MKISLLCFAAIFAVVSGGSAEKRLKVLEEKVEKLVSAFGGAADSKIMVKKGEEPTLDSEKITNSMASLQSQFDSLRNDYQRLHANFLSLEDSVSRNQPSLTMEENGHKTIEWLKTTVSELRNEVVDVARSINATMQITESEEMKKDINILRHEAKEMREVVDELLAEKKKTKSDLQELNAEVKRHLEERSILENAEKITPPRDIVEEVEEQSNTRKRHRRSSLHGEVDLLNHFVKSLIKNQEILERNMHKIAIAQTTDNSNLGKIEIELQSFLNKSPQLEELTERLNSIANKESKLESLLQEASGKVANIDKVQSSTLQLFEAMEGLEDKYDVSLRDMQTELAKIDAASQQLTIDVENIKEEEADERASFRSVRENLQKIQNSISMEKPNATRKMEETEEKEIQMKELLEEKSVVIRIGEMQRLYEGLLGALPKSCREVTVSGVSTLLPPGSERPLTAACDSTTEGGGWLVLQRRESGEENFNRDWESYKLGFGNPNGDYWLGNDQIHHLTKGNTTELRVDIWDIYGQYWWAQYDQFTVGDLASGYLLHAEGFHGNASDALSYHEGMKFSSLDHDQDISNTNCAQSYQGGWWYSHCQHVNINGKYALGLTWYNSSENEWIAVSKVEMKIREKVVART